MNIHINKQVIVRNLGLGDYKEIWDYQETIFKETVDLKITNRKSTHPHEQLATSNYLIYCEHPHVYTLGKKWGNRESAA